MQAFQLLSIKNLLNVLLNIYKNKKINNKIKLMKFNFINPMEIVQIYKITKISFWIYKIKMKITKY